VVERCGRLLVVGLARGSRASKLLHLFKAVLQECDVDGSRLACEHLATAAGYPETALPNRLQEPSLF
jgi:hypothetical protein